MEPNTSPPGGNSTRIGETEMSSYMRSPSSQSFSLKQRGGGKCEDDRIKGPWLENDYGQKYDDDQLTWSKVKSIKVDDMFTKTRAFIVDKGSRLNEIYFGGLPILDFFVPCMRWLRIYKWKAWLWNDIVAGIAIAAMVVPQGMSYASGIALLPKEYGLYTAFTPCLVYGFFGTSRQLAVGPVAVVATLLSSSLTNIMPPLWSDPSFGWNEKTGKSAKYTKPWNYAVHPKYNATQCAPLLDQGLENITPAMLNEKQYLGCRFKVYSELQDLYNKYAVQTALLVGLLQFILGSFRFGFLTNFLSHSVISGFTTGAAFIIGLGQVGSLLGYKLLKTTYVYQSLHYIILGLPKTSWRDFILSFVWLVILITFKEIGKRSKRLQFFRVVGPLTVCILGILVTVIGNAIHHNTTWQGYAVVGKVPSGMPPVSIQYLSLRAVSKLWRSVLAVASVDLMESIALGKAMARRNGYRIDSNDEYRALGVMNVVGSWFTSFPATGSFSRTSVNNSIGAKSPLACFTTGVVVGLVLLFITPIFKYLPNSALAAIIISGVLGLLEFREAKYLWRISKKDFVVWLVCWVSTMMLGVDIGLAISVGVAILIVIYESAFPHTAVLGRIPGTTVYRNVEQYPNAQIVEGMLLVRIDAPMYFANTTFIRDKLEEYIDIAMGLKKGRRSSNGSSDAKPGASPSASPSPDAAPSPALESSPGSTPPSSSGDVEAAAPVSLVRMGKGRIQYMVLDFSPVTRTDATSMHMLEELLTDLRSRGVTLVIVNPNSYVIQMFDLAGFTTKLGRENIYVRMYDAVVACSGGGC